MADQTTIVILHETAWQSLQRDIQSAAVLLGLVLVGWWIGSTALQWVAGLIWILWLVSRSTVAGGGYRGTPQGAADMLRDRFGVKAT